jgi:Cdc6-like AAA superfamily ATPase
VKEEEISQERYELMEEEAKKKSVKGTSFDKRVFLRAVSEAFRKSTAINFNIADVK